MRRLPGIFFYYYFLDIFGLKIFLCRKEIVLYREKSKLDPLAVLTDLKNRVYSFYLPICFPPLRSLPVFFLAAFRALVEENVKSNVQKIATSRVIYDVNIFVLT